MEKIKINMDSSLSLLRPAWTQYDLHAYRHKRTFEHGKLVILENFFVESNGLINKEKE